MYSLVFMLYLNTGMGTWVLGDKIFFMHTDSILM